jgi:predicted membrane protein
VSDESNFDPKKPRDDLRDSVHKFKENLRDQIHQTVEEGLSWKNENRGTPRRPVVIGIRLGRRSYFGGMFWGVILTVVGLGLLLDHMGIISIDRLWQFWPLLLVIAGIFNLRCREHRFWGLLLILGGAFLQGRELGLPYFGWVQFWPLVFISAGLLLMWNAIEARKLPAPSPGAASDPRTTVSGVALFSGLERRVTTQDFQGGNLSAVFGGIELDLTEANMQGNEATLEINAVFGGAEIRVPDTWLVSYQGAPIFGGVEDKTRLRRSEDPADPARKTLILTGSVIFGGLEIKN